MIILSIIISELGKKTEGIHNFHDVLAEMWNVVKDTKMIAFFALVVFVIGASFVEKADELHNFKKHSGLFRFASVLSGLVYFGVAVIVNKAVCLSCNEQNYALRTQIMAKYFQYCIAVFFICYIITCSIFGIGLLTAIVKFFMFEIFSIVNCVCAIILFALVVASCGLLLIPIYRINFGNNTDDSNMNSDNNKSICYQSDKLTFIGVMIDYFKRRSVNQKAKTLTKV